MTEQFSQEYIAFILSDEAKALQERIPVRFGTVVYSERIDRIAVVCGLEQDPDAVADLYVVFETYRSVSGLRRQEVVVFPTLFQLIGVIEGVFREQAEAQGLSSTPIMRARAILMEVAAGCAYTDDVMLAAAQLAVRAVEGG